MLLTECEFAHIFQQAENPAAGTFCLGCILGAVEPCMRYVRHGFVTGLVPNLVEPV